MGYKFIFDTNVIDPYSVPKMETAGIISACDSSKFNFYMTPPLLRECFHFVTTGKAFSKTAPLEFLIKIKWTGFLEKLNGKDGIFYNELRGSSEREYLLIENAEEKFKPQLRNVIDGKRLSPETQEMLEEDNNLWKANKEKDINDAINKRKSAKEYINKLPASQCEYENIWEKCGYKTIVPYYINGLAEKINPAASKEELIALWKKRQKNCKWLNNFIKLHYFRQCDLVTSQAQPAKDINAADDIEHMIYLLYVDGIVTKEKKGFMSKAKQFFPTKDILSVDEFVRRITQ